MVDRCNRKGCGNLISGRAYCNDCLRNKFKIIKQLDALNKPKRHINKILKEEGYILK